MRLGIDHLDRRVSEEDLARSLYEVSVRLPDQALQALSKTSIWPAVARASLDQNWWFKRTEYLVGRELVHRIGDWGRVYKSLSQYGLQFAMGQDYGSDLLLEVLFDLDTEVDLGIILPGIARKATEQGMLLVLSRIEDLSRDNQALCQAAEAGNLAALSILLADGRIDPAYDESLALRYAVLEGHTDCVKLLLADERVDASAEHNQAIHDVIEYNFYEIFDLLLEDKNVLSYTNNVRDGLDLHQAVIQNDNYFIQRISEVYDRSETGFVHRWSNPLSFAAKSGRIEAVKILLQYRQRLTEADIESSIQVADRRKNYEIVELLRQALLS
ncbi:Hypothetical protein POVR2_LOCUS295 [uncultured virus]|nr:Hypothetical protein POVR2_LOCUS295 [uncultured virus]